MSKMQKVTGDTLPYSEYSKQNSFLKDIFSSNKKRKEARSRGLSIPLSSTYGH